MSITCIYPLVYKRGEKEKKNNGNLFFCFSLMNGLKVATNNARLLINYFVFTCQCIESCNNVLRETALRILPSHLASLTSAKNKLKPFTVYQIYLKDSFIQSSKTFLQSMETN